MKAFVLSGGANLGAEQAGMLEALLGSGIVPDVLVGTSIGAANAAFLASEPSLDRARGLSGLWRRMRPRDVFPLNPIAVVRSALGRGALFPVAPWRRVLEREIPYARIEGAAVPLRIVATSFDDGSEVVFDRGPVVDAVIASTALPGIFPPHEIDGRLFLDGGLVDQIPLTPACEAGADTIYILSVGFPCPPPANRRSARALFMHSVGILLSQRVRIDGDHLPAHHGVRVVQIPPLCTQLGLRDFSRSGELIERAREQTARFLRQGGASPGPSLPTAGEGRDEGCVHRADASSSENKSPTPTARRVPPRTASRVSREEASMRDGLNVVRGERVGRAPPPNRSYGAGRVCATAGCTTRLSIYNPGRFCWRHEPAVLPGAPRKTKAA